jgi:hypothetical protein
MEYFPVANFDWFDAMFSSRIMLGSVFNVSVDPTAFPFHGSVRNRNYFFTDFLTI